MDHIMHEAIMTFRRLNNNIRQRVGVDAYDCTLHDGFTHALCVYSGVGHNTKYWYSFAMQHTSRYLLRMYCRHPANAEAVFLVSETFDFTLERWMGPIMEANGFIHPNFARILVDITQGLVYLHRDLRHRHGAIAHNTIYIVGGRAKLGNITRNDGYHAATSINSDCLSLRMVVQAVVQRLNVVLTGELQHFMQCLNITRDSPTLEYCCDHLGLLSPNQRNAFRIISKYNAGRLGLDDDLRTSLRRILGHQDYYTQWKESPTVIPQIRTMQGFDMIQNNAWGFLSASRNACMHVNDNQMGLNAEQLDEALNRIWPNFLLSWFDACYDARVPLPELWHEEIGNEE